jgi:membrane-associated phospholipid phosphatase
MPPLDSPSPKIGWAWIGRRFLILWPAKMIGTSLGMGLFFWAYFLVLNHPQYAVTVVPLLPLDPLISFRPEATLFYVSLWVYISLAPALAGTRREVGALALAWVTLSGLSLFIFLIWPTKIPALPMDAASGFGFSFLKKLDASGNACPSLHVAFAVFTAMWFQRFCEELRLGRSVPMVNWLWCAAIIYSTLAIRQHVMLDVLGGAGLGAAVGYGLMRRIGPMTRGAT